MKRLRILQTTFEDMNNTPALPFGFLFALWITGLVLSIFKPMSDDVPIGSFLMSNFATPDITSKAFGRNVVYLRVSFGDPKRGYPAGFSSISFKGSLLLQVNADAGLFPRPESTESILGFILDELNVLRNCVVHQEI
jgi:hypothetical protein